MPNAFVRFYADLTVLPPHLDAVNMVPMSADCKILTACTVRQILTFEDPWHLRKRFKDEI